MKTLEALSLAALAALCSTLAGAATFTWEGSATRYWANPAGWSGGDGTYPDDNTDTASINNDFINATTRQPILLADASGNDLSVTIKSFAQNTASSGNRTYTVQNVTGGSGTMTFENPAGNASISCYIGSDSLNFAVRLVLRSDLDISTTGPSSGTKLNVNAPIGEAGGARKLTKKGVYRAVLKADNTYSGGTRVEAGELLVQDSGTLGSGPVTVAAGTLTINATGGSIADEADVSVSSGAKIALGTSVAEKIGRLFLAGVQQPPGTTFGSTSSAAQVRDDTYFTGSGVLVTAPSVGTLVQIR